MLPATDTCHKRWTGHRTPESCIAAALQAVGPPPAPLVDAPAQLPPAHAGAQAADTGIPTTAELGYEGAATSGLKVCHLLYSSQATISAGLVALVFVQ